MARMVPAELDPDAPASEAGVFRRLRDRLPEAWTVLHGRHFLLPAGDREGPTEGEADFLGLDPARGWVALEVKGGGVRCEGRRWLSEGAEGREHAIQDPGRQASRVAHGIHRLVASQAAAGAGGRAPRFGWGVALPDVDVRGPLAPDDPPRPLVIDRLDLADGPKAAVERVFEAHGLRGGAAAGPWTAAFLRALAPTLRLVPPLARRIEREGEALLRLTREQASLLDALAALPRAAIEGGAGTGKTLLAAEKARRLAEEGRRTLLLCFNRPLADHLADGAEGYEADTFHGLCHRLCDEAGLPFEIPKAPRRAQRLWEEEAPNLLDRALSALPGRRFDALVVDEGQDFREHWWTVLETALAEPGESPLYVFYDPRQDLYGGGPPAALELAPVRLQWNCRNTARIARYAAGLLGTEPVFKPGTPESAPVEAMGRQDISRESSTEYRERERP